jgi:phosphopantetheinyl transferase
MRPLSALLASLRSLRVANLQMTFNLVHSGDYLHLGLNLISLGLTINITVDVSDPVVHLDLDGVQ